MEVDDKKGDVVNVGGYIIFEVFLDFYSFYLFLFIVNEGGMSFFFVCCIWEG